MVNRYLWGLMRFGCFGCFATEIQTTETHEKIATGILVLFVAARLLTNPVFGQEQPDSSRVEQGFKKYRFGGYGEILFQHMDYGPDRYNYADGAQPDKRSLIGLPRAVFSFDYKFRSDLIFSTELEFEHGGTGSAMELEYEEAGEYEMEIEKAGEVVFEQLHFTKIFRPWLKVRLGSILHLVCRFLDRDLRGCTSKFALMQWHPVQVLVVPPQAMCRLAVN